MIKPTYIVLSVLNVGFNALCSLMIINFFGAKESADVYMMCLAIVATLQLLQLLMIDQFLYFYLEKRREGEAAARSFFSTVFMQSLVMGLVFASICYFFTTPILKIFAYNLDAGRREMLVEIFNVLVWSLVIFGANFVIHRLLNAEEKFSYPYCLEMIVPLMSLLIFFYFFITGTADLLLIAYARLGGVGLSFILGLATLFKLGYFVKIEWFSRLGFACYRNSFSMRSGHNLHNFLFAPITNNVLSVLPVGSAAIYYYAERFAQLVNVVISGPLQRVYQVKISLAWLGEPYSKIVALMKMYLSLVIPLFTLAAVSFYFLIPGILQLATSGELANQGIEKIQALYAVLALWIGIIAVEHVFVAVGLVAKKSAVFIAVNGLFIFCYGALCLAIHEEYGLFAIPISALIAQIFSFGVFAVFAIRMIRKRPAFTSVISPAGEA